MVTNVKQHKFVGIFFVGIAGLHPMIYSFQPYTRLRAA